MNFFKGISTTISNLWTGLTGADIQARFTAKNWDKPLNTCPECAIIIFRGKGWVEGAIRKVTKSWANHAGIGIGGAITIEAENPKIKLDTLQRLGSQDQAFIMIKVDMNLPKNTILDYAKSCIGKPYAFGQIFFNYVLPDDDNNKSEDYCSELVARSFQAGFVKVSNDKPELTFPGALPDYCLSDAGKSQGWIIWDSLNITEPDIMATINPKD